MNWRSKLLQPNRRAPQDFHSLAAPTHRGSTVVFTSPEQVRDGWRDHAGGYAYGIYGTPTALELGARIAELEGALHTFIVPSGQSAIALIYLAFCKPGSHVLLPANAYSSNSELGAGLLRRYKIEVEPYDPLIGEFIAPLIRPETALIWCESPGSVTMEIQDVPAIVAAAHRRGIPVALDNTYAAGVLFDAFAHGVDVSMQALTKYIGGHSDLLLGSVSAGTQDAHDRLGATQSALGLSASPDDCSLALRGLQTLSVRLETMERSALAIANWLARQPEIDAVLHPALPSCPGHQLWQRDFTGSASLFSILLNDRFSPEQVDAFISALQLFKIGWSWGGVNSLIMAYPGLARRAGKPGRIVRLHIGLEDPADLIADLDQALKLLNQAS